MRAHIAAHVVFSWDDSAERTEFFAPGTRVSIGPERGATFALPPESIASNATLLESKRDAGVWTLTVPRGSRAWVSDVLVGSEEEIEIPMKEGSHARILFGSFELVIRIVELERQVIAAAPWDWGVAGWVGASAAVHLALIGAFLLLPPNASAINLNLRDDQERYIRAALMPREVEPEVLPQLVGTGETGGLEGSPAPGEAGEAGVPDAEPSKRGKIQSPGRSEEPRVALTKATAASLETLAVIRSAFVAVPSVFDVPVDGSDMIAALGPLLSDAAGIDRGTGLALHGPGRGGGCPPGVDCTHGTVGVGNGPLAGFGTCDSSAFRDLVASIGFRAARERCHTGPGSSWGPGDGGLRDHAARVPPRDPIGVAETIGGLSREQIQRVVRRNISQVRYCYERELQQQPDLTGTVRVRFVVRSDGAVQGSQVASSTASDAELEQCVSHAVERWAFPAAEGVTAVTYPFQFVPAS